MAKITWDISELSNGLRVVTTPVPTAQSVGVNVFVGAGSRAEPRRVNGLAHFLEHVLFKGSAKRPTSLAIAEAVEGAGGNLNAYTAKEVTCYWNHVPDDRLELALDVLADMVVAPLLPAEEIDRERSVVYQEIRRGHDQPSSWAHELLQRAYYGDHPLGWSTAGNEETVGAIQRDDFVSYMSNWYGPHNLVISVAGNTTHDRIMPAMERLLGGYNTTNGMPAFPALTEELPYKRVIVEERDIAQCSLLLALPGLSRNDPDRYISMIMNNILGRGMSSRLFKEVREKRGLAYSVGSSMSRHSDTGTMVVSAGVSRERLEEAVKVILTELSKMSAEQVEQDELTRARYYTIGSFRMGLESTMALAQRAGESLLTLGEIEPVESVVEKLRAVSAEDVQRVAGRIWQPERTCLAVVGPNLEEEALFELIAA